MVKRDVQAELAEFAATAVVPDDVGERMRERLLDTIAVGVFTDATEDFVEPLISTLERPLDCPGGAATVWGRSGLRVDWPQAGFINGALAHGSDFDDTQGESALHGSSVVVPAALAAGEHLDSDSRAVLDAMAVGLEVAVRLAGAGGHRFNARGFHTTPNFGVFGAAACVSRLLGLSPKSVFNAMGLSGSLASGLTQFSLGGGDVKRLHAGWAAQAGSHAARWAEVGLQGPAGIFDGRFGLYETHLSGPVDYEDLVVDLGHEWRCARHLVKAYPCCHHLHASIDAALESTTYPIHDIREITVLVPEGTAVDQVCEPETLRRHPTNPYEAKFSAFFVIAAALVTGRLDVATFSHSELVRPDIRDVASRTSYRVVRKQSAPGHAYPGGLELRMRDGRTITKWRDEPRRLTGACLLAKVEDCFRVADADARPLIDIIAAGGPARDIATAAVGKQRHGARDELERKT